MNFDLPTVNPATCWICGGVADSAEHKFKRSDIVARYERSWPPRKQPFIFRGDGRPSRIQGPNSQVALYPDMLCQACNNTRTKPFDLAYERFSKWVLAQSAALHDRTEIDFSEVFGPSYPDQTLKLLCYFAKSLGCRLVYAGIEPPKAFSRILTTSNLTDTLPLQVTFGINESWYRLSPDGRTIGKGDLFYWPYAQPSFAWSEHLGYLEIFYWFDAVWNPFPFGGDPMSTSLRTVRLGWRDEGDPADPKTWAQHEPAGGGWLHAIWQFTRIALARLISR
jgi:hypothetical protein